MDFYHRGTEDTEKTFFIRRGGTRQIKIFCPFRTQILCCIGVSCSFCDSIPEGLPACREFMIQSSPPDWIIRNPPLCSLCLRGDPVLKKRYSISYGRWQKFANSAIIKVLICHILRINCQSNPREDRKSLLIFKLYRSKWAWHGICSILVLKKYW